MSIQVNVKKYYKNVLPKVKGHRWHVDYMPEERILGNIGVYLWRGSPFWAVGDIVGSGYVRVTPSDTFEQAQELVQTAAEKALQEATDKGVQFKWGKPVAPDNITGKTK